MGPPPKMSLGELAGKLIVDGPVKYEPANRRVRGLVSGQWAFDTLDAVYVWEHPYFPFFYIPYKAFEKGPGDVVRTKTGHGYWAGELKVEQATIEIAGFEMGPLEGLVKIPHEQLDWYAEDEKLLGSHPKDPYKRIECLASSREVRIEIEGVVIARSTNSVFLHETGLRTRYYMAPACIVSWDKLIPSDTTSVCPYKGQAEYYDLRVGNEIIKDAVWYYAYPTAESALIQNRLCFYNEKVDVFIDGIKG